MRRASISDGGVQATAEEAQGTGHGWVVLDLVGPAAASLFACLLAILALRPVAVVVDLVDRPGGRKTHRGEVPIVGGIAMFLGTSLGVGLLSPSASVGIFLGACAMLVTTGLLDDRFELSPWTRLGVQAAASILMVMGSGISVTTIGNPFGTGPIELSGFGSHALTVLVTIAAINSFNMLDGMDGLAGAMALTGLIGLVWLASGSGLAYEAGVAAAFIGAVAAFLVFNLPARFNRGMRCFMGDAGSMLLGFAVAWLCVRISQQAAVSVAPVTMLWLVALPMYELLWTTLRRLALGVSPFLADRDHFHHLLIRSGLGVRGAFTVFVALATLLAAIGIALNRLGVPDFVSMLLFVLGGCGVTWLMTRAELLLPIVPPGLRRQGLAAGTPPAVRISGSDRAA
jgi:UDP-GlcNAc:undecaprenyl-phosphate GlcNAc-1-phosphate transferase